MIVIGDDMIVYNITPNELMIHDIFFFLFGGNFHSFFNQENAISTQTKDYCEMALICQISKNKNKLKTTKFLQKVPSKVAKI